MNRDLTGSLMWGGGIVTLALVATQARVLGYIDGDTVTRLVICAIGLMVAWQGNRLPKALAPTNAARRLSRVAGWSMALSGLVYAALFAFAPMLVAVAAGCGAIIVGMAVTVGYSLRLRADGRSAG